MTNEQPKSPPPRVLVTPNALKLIEELREKHGPLMFHQSGGCCDGSSPMCYPEGEFHVGGNDVKLGQIGGCPVYMDADQFNYWKHTQLIIDVVPGRGHGFSVEAPEGVRFLTRSRVFTDEEADTLAPPIAQRQRRRGREACLCRCCSSRRALRRLALKAKSNRSPRNGMAPIAKSAATLPSMRASVSFDAPVCQA